MDHAGIEPAVSRLQGGCLTVEANGPWMAGLTGFEPALSSETVRRGLRLPYRPRDGGSRFPGNRRYCIFPPSLASSNAKELQLFRY